MSLSFTTAPIPHKNKSRQGELPCNVRGSSQPCHKVFLWSDPSDISYYRKGIVQPQLLAKTGITPLRRPFIGVDCVVQDCDAGGGNTSSDHLALGCMGNCQEVVKSSH